MVSAGAALLLFVLALAGFGRGSGPDSRPLGTSEAVLIVSIPGLRWQDLVATETPTLDRLLGHSALLSVRAIGRETSVLEGYLSLNAGNRVEADTSVVVTGDRCIPAVAAAATRAADDDLNGAEPGALGNALAAAGVATSVYGSPESIAALMDSTGCVTSFSADPGNGTVLARGVTLFEYRGLEATEVAQERSARIVEIDVLLGRSLLPGGALAMLVAPAAPGDKGETTVVGVLTPGGVTPDRVGLNGDGGASLVSPTTRRADYVTLTDIAPTILAVVGGSVPDSMSGTEIATTGGHVDGRDAHLADLAERVLFRDRAVGPVIVVLVVLVFLCAMFAIGGRARLARMLAPIVIAYPTVAFAAGLVQYHQLPLDFFAVIVPVVSMVVATVAVSSLSRFGQWAPVAALATLLWLLLIVDVVTGSRLQINTPLGYTPTVAGRFQGYGNLAFGLVGAASIVVALVVGQVGALIGRRDRSTGSALAAARVGAVTVVAVAAPAFGSDVGGTLALLPAFAVMVILLAGWRISKRRLLVIATATIALVVAAGAFDMSRSESSRTHLGRFLDDLLHGDGALVIRRKLRGNLAILTSSFWSFLLVAVLLAAVAVAWRRRDRLRLILDADPALRVFVTGFVIMAVLGFALNDSGLAVPAIMSSVAVPWLVATRIEVVQRAGR
jgi:hypothetical protein